MGNPSKDDDGRSDDEATECMNRALKRALSTPPKPKQAKDRKPKRVLRRAPSKKREGDL